MAFLVDAHVWSCHVNVMKETFWPFDLEHFGSSSKAIEYSSLTLGKCNVREDSTRPLSMDLRR